MKRGRGTKRTRREERRVGRRIEEKNMEMEEKEERCQREERNRREGNRNRGEWQIQELTLSNNAYSRMKQSSGGY